jgi:hypothetical protein
VAFDAAAHKTVGELAYEMAGGETSPPIRRAAAKLWADGHSSYHGPDHVASLLASDDPVVQLEAARIAKPFPVKVVLAIADDGAQPANIRLRALRQLNDLELIPPDTAEPVLTHILRTTRGNLLQEALAALVKLGRPPPLSLLKTRFWALSTTDQAGLLGPMHEQYGAAAVGFLHWVAETSDSSRVEAAARSGLADLERRGVSIDGGGLALAEGTDAAGALSPVGSATVGAVSPAEREANMDEVATA